ncbi:MAG: TIR domain-containing protein [Candidatus Aminicenantes bacterium]|nr:MAG: TIR domain-containing protein [Candidatus Aminicenantes bacterium]
MNHQVFISYASEKSKESKNNFDVAEKIYKSLEAKNIRCWLAPKEIQPGDTWINEIINAVEQAKVVVLVFSSNANQSNWVKREINHALDKNKTIITFCIENVLPQGIFKLLKSNFQWLKAYTPPLKTHIDKLVEAAQKHLGIASTPPKDLPLNPFTEFMAIRDPARFIGREAELRRLMTLLQRGSVALLGEPKIGKSSLLRHLARHWQGKVIGPLDCHSLKDRSDFFQNISGALDLDNCDWQTIRAALNLSQLLFLLDELDYGPECGITHAEIALFRSVCDSNRDFKMVAVSRTPLKEVFPDIGRGSPAFNFLVPFTLGPFNEAECRQVLAHPWEPDVPFFDAETCEQLVELTGCHPYKLQCAAFHRFEALADPAYDWQTRYQQDMEQML